MLGGQGGDEIFGGYVRYLIAYFEQCIKGAIDGTMHSGNFVVTYESIIPNLGALREYKPLLKEFWSQGLFDELDARYFRLDQPCAGSRRGRSTGTSLARTRRSRRSGRSSTATTSARRRTSTRMTHFDFKTLLPALLQVEDRVSMAHGLESRVPFLDHPVVELAATMPADVKFRDGHLKHVLKRLSGPLARLGPVAARQDGLPGAAARVASRGGAGARVRLRRTVDGESARPRVRRQPQGPRGLGPRADLRSQALGAALPRALATCLPRQGRLVPRAGGGGPA